MRGHPGTPTHAPKRAVASSVATKLLYQRLSWSIDVLQELRRPPTPPRRDHDHQPEQPQVPRALPAATLIFPALGLGFADPGTTLRAQSVSMRSPQALTSTWAGRDDGSPVLNKSPNSTM